MSNRFFDLEQELSQAKEAAQQGFSEASSVSADPSRNRLFSLAQHLEQVRSDIAESLGLAPMGQQFGDYDPVLDNKLNDGQHGLAMQLGRLGALTYQVHQIKEILNAAAKINTQTGKLRATTNPDLLNAVNAALKADNKQPLKNLAVKQGPLQGTWIVTEAGGQREEYVISPVGNWFEVTPHTPSTTITPLPTTTTTSASTPSSSQRVQPSVGTAQRGQSRGSAIYHPYLYHMDLCILAYQLYNQTLIWPLDPWYERLRTSSTQRRENFMAKVHEYFEKRNLMTQFSGPGSAKRWTQYNNKELDPIVSILAQFSPWRGCFTRDDKKYRVFCSPNYITDKITHTYLCSYQSQNPPDPYTLDLKKAVGTNLIPIGSKGNTQGDVLYAFEGGTGFVPPQLLGNISRHNKPAAWSLMGYVLKRYRDDAGYDVHIVFRGSQSGSAVAGGTDGLMKDTGNPDWVTDMNNALLNGKFLVEDPQISTVGKINEGFSNSVKLCFRTITSCLEHISEKENKIPPRQIYVAGHSLGGALAAQFSSAVVCGNYEQMLSGPLKAWPWVTLQLFTFGAPPIGNKAFVEYFHSPSKIAIDKCHRILVKGALLKGQFDPITYSLYASHVGTTYQLSPTVKRDSLFDYHHPCVIREELINDLKGKGTDFTNTPLNQAPWREYDTFRDMFEKDPLFQGPLAKDLKVILPNFNQHIDLYIQLLAEIMTDKTTYSSPGLNISTDRELAPRITALTTAFKDKSQALDVRIGLLKNIFSLKDAKDPDSSDRYLILCLILNELIASGGDAFAFLQLHQGIDQRIEEYWKI